MQIINIANNQRLKKGDVFYLNFSNIFLLTLKYFNTNSDKNISILNFEILIDYNIFLNIYKKNLFSRGTFGELNSLKFNEPDYNIKIKEEFEKKVLKDFKKINYKITTILAFYTLIIIKQNKENVEINRINTCYKKLSGFKNIYNSSYKINGVYAFRQGNIIIFCDNLDKNKNNVLNNINNYINTDLSKKIMTTEIQNYNYKVHFNCCGFSYLSINTFEYLIPEELKLLCNNYFKNLNKENYLKIEDAFIKAISEKIIKLFFPLMCKNNKSILLSLDRFYIYFLKLYNLDTYYELKTNFSKIDFKEKIIKNLNSNFRSTIINETKILIEI